MGRSLSHRHRHVPLVACLFLLSCSGAPAKKAEIIPVWPLPPDPPRFIYEATLRADLDLGPQQKSMLEQVATPAAQKRPNFSKPYDVAARNGRIVISDTASRLVHLFDFPRRQIYQFGFRGDGKLSKPMGLAMDAQGAIYVADVTARQVAVYDPTGHFKRHVGSAETLVRPTDVAVNDAGDRIYVVDAGGIDSADHRVVIYSGEGQILHIIGTRGGESGQFNLPVQAAVGPDGRLYVLDAGNFRVQVFNRDGGFLKAWGKLGRNYGDLARPRGIAVDNDGNVYITDAAFANFQVFDPDGRLLLDVGSGAANDGPGRFSLPAGIAIDETERLYVVDQFFNKVEVIRRLKEAAVASPR